MKIAILSRKASLYSTRRLREAGIARGHEVHVVDYLRCFMDITSHHPKVIFQGKTLDDFDAIIPRIGASVTVLRHGCGTTVRDNGRLFPQQLGGDLPLSRQTTLTAAALTQGNRPAGHGLRPLDQATPGT
jgi:hypothetical protein